MNEAAAIFLLQAQIEADRARADLAQKLQEGGVDPRSVLALVYPDLQPSRELHTPAVLAYDMEAKLTPHEIQLVERSSLLALLQFVKRIARERPR